jgi:integrase
VYADLVQVLASTGLRWGEARAMLVRDFAETPMPRLSVIRNQPEGVSQAAAPKSRKTRHIPLPDAVLPPIRRFAAGKNPEDLLFTTPRGGQLHRSRFVQSVNWAVTGRGRTLHDLRHTAACQWILQGVPLTTVQAWLGHSSIEITARYLHHLGDYADRTALQLLNATPPAPRPRRPAAPQPKPATANLSPLSAFGGSPSRTDPTARGLSL